MQQRFSVTEISAYGNCHYPGKRESALSTANAESDSNSTERRHITIQLVGTGNRSSEYIRVENCADGIQFLVRTTARGAEWSDSSDKEV